MIQVIRVPWVATTVTSKTHRYLPHVIGHYRDCRGVRYGERERGVNTGGGRTNNGGDNGEGGPGGDGKQEQRCRGRGRRARVEGGKTWGPVVGYVQPYQEAYGWDGAD